MQVIADFLWLFHHLNQLVGQILGMGGHETDALQPLNLLHLPQQLRKGDGRLQRFPVGIHILSQQHDFHHAVGHQTFNLV